MKNIPILKTINRIPGGMMIVFLFLGCIVNTFAPKSLEIGSFTTALFKNGALPLIAVLLFCSGAQITIKTAGVALWKGVVLNSTKVILGLSIGVILGKVAGPEALLFGISPIAFMAAMANSNGGLYTALAQRYGNESDIGAVAIISMNDGPFFTMLAMGATGMADIPLTALIAVIMPIVIGMILGNLDSDIKDFLKPGIALSIPFFAFPLGAGLNLNSIINAGFSGVMLGVLTVVVTGMGGYFLYKFLIPNKYKTNNCVGASIGTTAGNAVGTPVAVAQIDPTWAAVAAVATVQVSSAIVITAILCPFLVDFICKLEKKKVGQNI